jgi:predicted RNA-binding Zn-ribbon protein involved in translation (DUF1610 family)
MSRERYTVINDTVALEDMSKGAQYIPSDVTRARRAGDVVEFNTDCDKPCCWYWTTPSGHRIYHHDASTSLWIHTVHGGKCPSCGNTTIRRPDGRRTLPNRHQRSRKAL